MIRKYARLYLAIVVFLAFCLLTYILKLPVLTGITFYSIFLFLLFINNKKSVLQTVTMDNLGKAGHLTIVFFALVIILVCILPMDLSPFWNGRIPMHRNQYELLADSMLEGHLYIDYDDIDPKLLEMANPYSVEERIRLEVNYHWDHAFYNGHYYMYFGVVPVIVLFIPFKLIFGKTLVTFHATQFFVMFSIVAFFLLFYMLSKKFFNKMTLGTYILLCYAACLVSVGYCVQAPALYCTAISGGIFFMLWSFVFYFLAVFLTNKEWKQVLFATLGALCGALAFGCRPPVALANLIAIPMAVSYAKNYKGKHIIRNFIIIVMPYVVIGALLMTYNYLRFDTPFEFGQAYQLTSADQTVYMTFTSRFNLPEILSNTVNNFFTIGEITDAFPYIWYGGLFITYPLMWLIVIYYSKGTIHSTIKRDNNSLLVLFLLLEPVFVSCMDSYWAPGLCERYRLDEYFVVSILMFVLVGYRLASSQSINRTKTIINFFAVLSIMFAVLMFFVPCDANYTDFYPDKYEEIKHILTFGIE